MHLLVGYLLIDYNLVYHWFSGKWKVLSGYNAENKEGWGEKKRKDRRIEKENLLNIGMSVTH